MTVEPDRATLAWRIPPVEERLALRMARVRWFLTLVVFSLVIVFAWPSDTRLLAFAVSVPLLAALWWWLVQRTQQRSPRDPNVWLDAHELRWQDNQGRVQRLARETVTAYSAGDEGPQGPVRLRLVGGFLSQPIAVHAPASIDQVRNYLQNAWKLAEQPFHNEEETHGDCLARLAIYSEMHDEDRVWHLEGDGQSLTALAHALEQAAHVDMPPTGAAPRAQHLITTRRDESAIHLLVDQSTMLGIESVSAPPNRLIELAALLRQELAVEEEGPERSFDWSTDDGLWTIALHVR